MDLDYFAMASARSPVPRRTVAPVSLTPAPKPSLSVEEWEAKAPLSDLATRSISAIKAASEKPPLPLKVSTFSWDS